MSTESRELPELPKEVDEVFAADIYGYDWLTAGKCYYTPDQMRAYALAALAHSRAQDSGGEAALLRQARAVLVRVKDDDAATLVNRIDARLSAAEQPAKGEGACRCTSSDPWDCIRTDDLAGLPCFCKCHTAAQQSSDPADDDFDVLYAAEPDSKQAIKGICRYWYERGRAVTPPTAQRHDEARRAIAWAVETRNHGLCYSFSDEFVAAFPNAPVDYVPAHGAGAAVEAVAWTVFDAKGVRFTLYNRELAEAIAERGLLVLPMTGNYEWYDAKVDTWKPINRLPYTWERELGIQWRQAALSTQPLLSDQPAGINNESLPEFLERVAQELEERDVGPGSFASGVACSLRGRAYILRSVAALHPEQAKDGGAS